MSEITQISGMSIALFPEKEMFAWENRFGMRK